MTNYIVLTQRIELFHLKSLTLPYTLINFNNIQYVPFIKLQKINEILYRDLRHFLSVTLKKKKKKKKDQNILFKKDQTVNTSLHCNCGKSTTKFQPAAISNYT